MGRRPRAAPDEREGGPAMRVFSGLDDLRAAKGEHLGHSDWHVIDQRQVDQFAEVTGDHQWIHTDPARAAAGPFGGTIAHGYLTLSLVVALSAEIYTVSDVRMGVNYGLDRVRFPSPVRVGSRVRAGAELLDVADVEGGVQLHIRVTVQAEGDPKP